MSDNVGRGDRSIGDAGAFEGPYTVTNYRQTRRTFRLSAFAGGLALLCAARSPAQDEDSVSAGSVIEKGVTQPSLRKEISFASMGVISKVSVKDGDAIHAGQELMRQYDKVEIPRLEGLKLKADQSLLIKAKQATLENKKLVLKRKEESFKKQALSELEYREAQLDVVTAAAEVDIAGHEAQTNQADVDTQQGRVEQLTLKCPDDLAKGIVEKLVQTEGEMASTEKPSIAVVQNDPLYIDMKTLPTAVVQKLKKGDTLPVRYPGESQWHPATINFVAPVADARAGTQAIRLEMPNPDGRATGLAIDVKVPNSTVADAR